MSLKILLVEDVLMLREFTSEMLSNIFTCEVTMAENGKVALKKLSKDPNFDIVICDVKMPEMGGLEFLTQCQKKYPDLPVIILTSMEDSNTIIAAMRKGARDFLIKPPQEDRLRVSIENALRLNLLQKEVTRLKTKETGIFSFKDMIGHAGDLSRIVKTGKKIAASDIPVIIYGETGVGKEVLAHAIHGESNRAKKSFVAINCGAIPEKLIESTLFGHEKGAFTGADKAAIGKFREAEGGTVFLDEIAELPLEAQVKLLRVLQQKEINSVGSSKTVPVDIRIISATNKDLKEEVQAGRFREDLYFRLNVMPIKIPPLSERRNDIPDLIRHFVERYTLSEGRPLKTFSKEAEQLLIMHRWKGNIRELENTVYRAIVITDEAIIQKEDVLALLEDQNLTTTNSPKEPSSTYFLKPDGTIKTMEEIEDEAIQFTLSYCRNSMSEAGRLLGISRSTLYRKINKNTGEKAS